MFLINNLYEDYQTRLYQQTRTSRVFLRFRRTVAAISGVRVRGIAQHIEQSQKIIGTQDAFTQC